MDSFDQMMGDAAEREAVPPVSKRILAFISSTLAVALCFGFAVSPVAVASSAGVNAGVDYWASLPTHLKQYDIPLTQKSVLLDKDGKEFAELYTENRELLKLKDANKSFVNSLIATEDSRFWDTKGLDYIGLARSVVKTATGSRQGGSGITQQLVKSLQIMNSEDEAQAEAAMNRSAKVKVQELKYAIDIQNNNSKEDILEKYLNTVYFGNGAYGLSAASKTYFNKPQSKLTPGEAATLVGIINNPTMFDPFTANESSKNRRNTVLWRALDEGTITQEQYDAETAKPLVTHAGTFKNGCSDSKYPFYCDMVRRELLDNPAYGKTPEDRKRLFAKGGLRITTAMDRKVMDISEQEAKRAYGVDNRVGTGIAVVEPGTGKVRGIAQNRDWGSNGPTKTELTFATSNRQPGSSFKPITLTTALEQGLPPTTQLVSNGPYIPADGNAPPGGFTNYGNYNWGSVDAYRATQMSMNVYFVKLMEKTGVLPVADMAKRLGMNSLPREGSNAITSRDYSLTLGGYETSPLQMATVYATFASGGVKCEPVSVVSATRIQDGKKIKVSDPDCHQAIMPHVANTVSRVLQEPFKGDGSLGGKSLEGGRQAAGKTGTTNDWADAWMVGYTPQYATAVWSGDPRGGSQYPLTNFVQYGVPVGGDAAGDGSKVSAPVWKSIMDRMHRGLPNKTFPKADDGASTAVSSRAVPDVNGMDVNTAITMLQDEGFKVTVSKKTGKGGVAKNVVVAQHPEAGGTGVHGDTVDITLSEGSDVDIEVRENK